MAAKRFYYSDTITDFLSRSTNEIVGKLTLVSQHDINDETAQSWVIANYFSGIHKVSPYRKNQGRAVLKVL